METLRSADFESKVINSDKPVLVDFFATWCGPCKMMAPLVEAIKNEHPEIEVVKVDVEDAMEWAQKYKVQAVPTFVLIKNGEAVAKRTGGCSKEELESFALQ